MQKTPGITGGRLEFAGLDLKDRFETSLACEIWLDDACNARWATNNTMKLAAVVAQSIKNNDGRPLEVSRLDMLCAMTRDDASIALRQMRMFGLIAEYKLDGGIILLACRLSHAGQIRFLDMKQKFDLLDGLRRQEMAAIGPKPSAPAIALDPGETDQSAIGPSNVVAFRPHGGARRGANLACGGSVA
jgi:hypothetical protein